MKRILKWSPILLILFLIIAQFFPIDKTAPVTEASQDFITMKKPPAEVANLLKGACYDCHSHETQYPWYTSVAPLSWWIGGHIKNGRQNTNFSTWGSYDAGKQSHKIEECIEEIEAVRMPPKTYRFSHSIASFSDSEQTALINWLKSVK